MKKPQTIDEYIEWLRNYRKVEISELTRDRYNSVANSMRQDFDSSKFWNGLLNSLRGYDHEYQKITGCDLFIPRFEPELKVKPFKSFLEKTYRKNVLDNTAWPEEPGSEWIIPDVWFSQINDIVRTLFIVRYFDGVKFLIGKVEELCKKHTIELEVDYEAREEGYYAAHLYLKTEYEVPRKLWDTKRIFASVELQITTQLQEVIRRLLHSYYEKKRIMVEKPVEKWQWDYKCEEFCVNYLGHILHYVEGMIVEVREKQKKENI